MNWEFRKEHCTEKSNNMICKLIKKTSFLVLFISTCFLLNSCGAYNFTGTGKIDADTFQVNFFQNTADIIEPGIDRTFTNELQDLIQNQTNLNLVSANGDLVYEGEITDYRNSPMTATADQLAAQTRLTIRIHVRFTNKKNEADDFEKDFSFFFKAEEWNKTDCEQNKGIFDKKYANFSQKSAKTEP